MTDYRFFRVISQYVYLVHPAYIYILQMLLSNTVSIAEASWLYFLVVMILTLITAVVIAKIGDARKIRKQMQVES